LGKGISHGSLWIAPKTPDPKETASAQTATNIGTAIANGYLGNVNQVTPDGNLTYSQTGTNKWTDPLNGKTYDLPTWTATTTLSQAQQAIKNQEDAASLNLATLANTQSNRLNSLLANPFTMNGAPAAGDVSKLTAPTYQQLVPGRSYRPRSRAQAISPRAMAPIILPT